MSDPAPAACEECGGSELVKVLFPVAVHYKGSGFYSTDYAGKGKPATASDSSSDSGTTAASGDSGSSTTSTPAPSTSSD